MSNTTSKRPRKTKSRLQRGSRHDKVGIDQAELDRAFIDNPGGRFPPILSVQQAAQLLQVSINTIYEWSSKGYLKGCCRKRGRRLFFWRDALIRELFEGKEWKP